MKRNSEIKGLFLEHLDRPTTELKFSNLYELLVCVMLSVQYTDKGVSLIAPELFKTYLDITSLANVNLSSLKTYIQSYSFYNNRTQNLIKMAQSVCEDFNAEIPLGEEKLKSLAGVGQKTTHVVLVGWYDANCMAVDTHVLRVSYRLGLSKAKTPEAIGEDLTRIFKDDLNYLHQAVVLFGRYICRAKKPLCKECFLNHLRKSKGKELE